MGTEIKKEKVIHLKNVLNNKNIMEELFDPKTFLTAISLVFFSEIKIDNPRIPKQAIKIAKNVK